MFRDSLVRLTGLALATYGVIGLFVVAIMVLVGTAVFREVERTRAALEQERLALVGTLRTVSATFDSTANATESFEQSLHGARASAESAAQLATDTSASFRGIAQAMQLNIFGLQPLAALAPGFTQMAQQLEQMGGTLSVTAGLLADNARDIRRVGGDLERLSDQMANVAQTVDRATALQAASQNALFPFQLAYFGMCLLLGMQSVFSLIAGFTVARYLGRLRAQRQQARVAESEQVAAVGPPSDVGAQPSLPSRATPRAVTHDR